MGKDSSGSGPVQIDERWLSEWFELGWSGPDGLIEYLTKHARFDAWSAEHERKEPA